MHILRTMDDHEGREPFQYWGHLPESQDSNQLADSWRSPDGRWELQLISKTHPPFHPHLGVLLIEHPDASALEVDPGTPSIVRQLANMAMDLFHSDAEPMARQIFENAKSRLSSRYDRNTGAAFNTTEY